MTSDASSVSGGLGRRRWLVLGVVGLAQLMVVLDLTIMNIALPSAQRALHFTTVEDRRHLRHRRGHRWRPAPQRATAPGQRTVPRRRGTRHRVATGRTRAMTNNDSDAHGRMLESVT